MPGTTRGGGIKAAAAATTPGAGVLFEETWDVGTAWSSTRWPTIATSSSSTVDIQSQQGRLNPDGAAYTHARALSASGNIGDFDLTVQLTLSTTGEQYHSLTFRHSNGWAANSDPQDGYSAMAWQSAAGASNLSFIPVVAGARGTVITVTKSWGTSAWDLRVQAIGSAIRIKAWQGTEPSTWDIETTNASHASGIIGFSSVNGNATTARPVLWDSLLVVEATESLSAPVNTALPVISPTSATVGQTLSCTTGTWNANPAPAYSYQWKRDEANVGTNSSTYVTTAAGSHSCVVTATNSEGSANATAATVTVSEQPQTGLLRLLVTSDIGGDPDDIQSMTRLLAYSNEFQIVGLIATQNANRTSPTVRPDFIDDIIDNYATVRNNLLVHKSGYPTAADLHAVVKGGNTAFANTSPKVNAIGIGNDSAGSNHIITAIDASNERTHVCIFGGQGDFGQAMFDAKRLKTTAQWQAFVAKIRVYAIGDQDSGLSSHLRTTYPELWYVENGPTLWGGLNAAFRGMYHNDSTGDSGDPRQLVETAYLGINNTAWVQANVSQNHGALGAAYPDDVEQHLVSSRNTTGVKEGDTPSWFYFLQNGMQDPEQPTWGGWGGRFIKRSSTPGAPEHYVETEDTIIWRSGTPPTSAASTRRKWTVARWREAYQLDFRARMDWCVQSTFAGANHPPVAVLNGDTSKNIVLMPAAIGSTVNLSAAGSTDPDGNTLSYRWAHYVYRDDGPGTYTGTITISNSTSVNASFVAPNVTPPQTIHIILEVRDNGTPNLTSYRRLIVSVESAALSAPVNTSLPVISPSSSTVGQTLSCTTGSWTGNPTPTYAYQWKRDGGNVGTNSFSYVTTAAGLHSCVVTATNSQGSASATAADVTVTAGGGGGNPFAGPTTLQSARTGDNLTSVSGTVIESQEPKP